MRDRPPDAASEGGSRAIGPERTLGLVAGLGAVSRSPGARRLAGVRLVGQASDGVLQAALASLVLLSPEHAATAGGIAAASAVLLLPFTLVGPWAASVVDRFRRRQVLVVASAVRAATAAAAALALLDAPEPVVAVLALAYLSVNRLLLAALSASLPRVVAGPDLVAANAVLPTAGSAVALAGGAGALALGPLLGVGDAGSSRLLLLAAAGCALAGLLALRLGADQLGPDQLGPDQLGPDQLGPAGVGSAGLGARTGRTGDAKVRPGADLLAALAHLRARPSASSALAAITLHRLGYGVVLVALLLLARERDTSTPGAAAALLGTVLGASAAGFALAALVTPAGARAMGARAWVVLWCALAALAPLVLLTAPGPAGLVATAAVLGLATQSVKVSVDSLVQAGVDDAVRGRVFVVYDALFNASLVAATALAALLLPGDGWSPPALGALAVGWLALAAGYWRASARSLPLGGGVPGRPAGRA